jgi:hypothetical protein
VPDRYRMRWTAPPDKRGENSGAAFRRRNRATHSGTTRGRGGWRANRGAAVRRPSTPTAIPAFPNAPGAITPARGCGRRYPNAPLLMTGRSTATRRTRRLV